MDACSRHCSSCRKQDCRFWLTPREGREEHGKKQPQPAQSMWSAVCMNVTKPPAVRLHQVKQAWAIEFSVNVRVHSPWQHKHIVLNGTNRAQHMEYTGANSQCVCCLPACMWANEQSQIPTVHRRVNEEFFVNVRVHSPWQHKEFVWNGTDKTHKLN